MNPKQMLKKLLAAQKEILGKCQNLMAEMKAIQGSTEKEQDDAKKAGLFALLEGKQAEFDVESTRVQSNRAEIDRLKILIEAQEALEIDGKSFDLNDPAGNTTTGGGGSVADPITPVSLEGAGSPQVPLEAKDYVAIEGAKVDAFLTYCSYHGHKRLSGKQYDLLKPTSEGINKIPEAKEGAIKVPDSFMIQVLGKQWYDALVHPAREFTERRRGIQGMSGKAIASDVDTALIGRDFRPDVQMLPPEPAWLLPFCDLTTTTIGAVDWPKLDQTDNNEFGGTSFEWIGEGGEKPESEPTWSQLQITCHEAAARTAVTNRMLSRSAVSLEPFLAKLFRGAIYNGVDNAILSGSGVGQPLGVTNDASVRTVLRTTLNAIAENDFINLEHTVLAHHRAGARYAMADGTLKATKQLVDSNNRRLWQAGLASGQPAMINGYPYSPTHRLTAYADGDVIFGNWFYYKVAMEQDVVIKKSEHVLFTQNQTMFAVFMLVGGRAIQGRAFAVLQESVV